ncbi:ribosome maturation factor RimM [Apibacter raozihei]|uniref:ribosome maturation factor RimM n=1 Tax=Apibacter TaxID=1778601 RepID=UPI000FE32CF0|nr:MULTISPECIES: ribosome maturation factor RimM [Apibacter]
MQLKDCYYLGTITRTHGLKGHLVVKLDTDEPEAYNNLESVYVDFNGMPVPFFINECQPLGNLSLRIKFEDSSLDIQTMIGCDLYLPLSTLPKLDGKQFYYHEVINFNIYDDAHHLIGSIIEINAQGPQALFLVRLSEDKEILIPIINDWIIEVHREEKYISMKLPEGILDL